ncbi:MAG: precorrin-6y C5,15-methyltransferase (decarboxylating) subunit CbiE [Caloramator sp.]|nr:precorrin-6y C5,15-methyltransferase (decarboxylating) subunit CbiE [Caloramator sp.]
MLSIIGMGPGDIKYVTFEALEKIKCSDKVIAFGRISHTAKKITSSVITIKNLDEIKHYINEDEKTSILASGDPCFYGIADYIRRCGYKIDEIIPGISSFQYMMAKIQKNYDNVNFISLHGRNDDLQSVKCSKISVILTDKENTPNVISMKLREMGIEGDIFAGFNLSYEDEFILKARIGDSIDDISSLSLVVIENEIFKR